MLRYLYVPVFAGILYRLRKGGYRALLWAMGMQIVSAGLAYRVAGTLFTAGNIYVMCTILLVIAVAKGWFLVDKKRAIGVILGVLVILPAALIIMKGIFSGYGFQVQRLLAWLNPERDAGGAGYVYQWLRQEWGMVRLVGAADNSPLLGDSLIGGPFFTEPFILLQLICKYGILAGAALVVAFAAVVVRAFQIAKRQKNQLGFMLSVASFMVILLNCLEGILINTGYFLVSSMQFPFVTYSACTAMTYAALIGLLLSIYRNERIVSEETFRRPTWRLTVKWEKR